MGVFSGYSARTLRKIFIYTQLNKNLSKNIDESSEDNSRGDVFDEAENNFYQSARSAMRGANKTADVRPD